MSRKRLIVSIVFSVLTVLLLVFIFGQSSIDAEKSDAKSIGLTQFINNFFESIDFDIVLTNTIIRKLAHFAEYFVLGFLLCATVFSYTWRLKLSMFFAPLSGLVVSALDELSQTFSKGRSPQITDVIIDFFGVITAVAITSLFIFLIFIRRKKDKN